MRYLTFIILCLSVIAMSCVGNNRSYKTNKDIFEDGNHSQSFLEIEDYVPENFSKVTIDSISSVGYKVHAAFSIDMETSTVVSKKINSLTQKIHFRELITQVKIYKDNSIVFNGKVDKRYLITKGILTEEDAKRFAINDFNMYFNTDGHPILSLHYVHTISKELKIINYHITKDKSFFEIIT